MKLKNKIIIVLIILTISIMSISTISLADKYTPSIFGNAIRDTDVEDEDLKSVGGKIVGIIQIVGTVISVGMLTIIGIKYVLGSAEEKASYKKTLIPYIVGAILLFGATNLTQAIYEWKWYSSTPMGDFAQETTEEVTEGIEEMTEEAIEGIKSN